MSLSYKMNTHIFLFYYLMLIFFLHHLYKELRSLFLLCLLKGEKVSTPLDKDGIDL